MSEVAIYQPQRELVPLAASPRGELDDWIMVADQVVRLAEVICRSPFVPDGLRGSAPATAAAILTGRELGIPPMTSLANIHVIHGKPGLSALVMRALVMREGHDWEDVEVNNTRVVLRGKRKGASVWTTASFSSADAQTAKLVLGGYPQDKLYARASARLARRAFADVIAGMPYAVEELEDGVVPDEMSTDVGASAPDSNGSAPSVGSKPRTAQRASRQRTATTAPADRPPAPEKPATPDPSLPPLPDEDEVPTSGGAATSATAPPNGGDSSGNSDSPDEPVTNRQLTAIWTTLAKDFSFTDDEKDMARAACGSLSGRGSDLPSTKELTKADAGTVIDALAHLKAQAEAQGEHPRSLLIALLAEREEGEVPGE